MYIAFPSGKAPPSVVGIVSGVCMQESASTTPTSVSGGSSAVEGGPTDECQLGEIESERAAGFARGNTRCLAEIVATTLYRPRCPARGQTRNSSQKQNGAIKKNGRLLAFLFVDGGLVSTPDSQFLVLSVSYRPPAGYSIRPE